MVLQSGLRQTFTIWNTAITANDLVNNCGSAGHRRQVKFIR
jgi:hypothetical protein